MTEEKEKKERKEKISDIFCPECGITVITTGKNLKIDKELVKKVLLFKIISADASQKGILEISTSLKDRNKYSSIELEDGEGTAFLHPSCLKRMDNGNDVKLLIRFVGNRRIYVYYLDARKDVFKDGEKFNYRGESFSSVDAYINAQMRRF